MNRQEIIEEGLRKICESVSIPYSNEVKAVKTTLTRLASNNPINVLEIEEVVEALDPCPWCGGEVELVDTSPAGMAPAEYQCACKNENCSVQPSSQSVKTQKHVSDFGYVPKEWQKPLIEPWNEKGEN